MALSDVKVRSAKPETKAYKLTDGDGMVLLVHPNGSKYWRLRYRFGGKEKMLALGKYPEVSLADARARRGEARKLLANGVDPSENKKAVKVEQEQEAITFEVVARDWHASNQKWSASHSARVLKSLEDNLFAAIGKRNIADLKTRDLLVSIKAVESSGRLEVAARLQQRTTAIMRFAVQSGLIDYNPAQDIAGAVATAKRQHRAALELNRISHETLFTGTINHTQVHPREVVKAGLKHNCAAVIVAHSHPSGEAEPSKADRQVTTRIQQALELVDIRLLDHLVVGGMEIVSFSERGWL
ncbi:integrase arm-type DNA-binding domain-containing protein [Salmonella enterica]|uniref:DUF4102 domain-containing protein n=2 Tax=Salmonella enterica TaxID=28901 RepID=A0A5Y4ZEL0_SALER|nr:DUF4102 domain-containing protein [Salmonella enterica]EBP3987981.1 DUF4102 domain-containing protein [Salmonella enterica subsp. enterica]ECE5933881.1 DUF4102 domain-containing protein [Salmonella enterica subsp. houtenae]EDG3663152.1 DUF4102 domain-containing protein [Salmonella enterica subsp. enterica serovar Give]EEH8775366.1 integrase arm-type DNA-binding domain-containing protein [Salmonella enterica subsp. houtenae serovar 44:z4,z23:-]